MGTINLNIDESEIEQVLKKKVRKMGNSGYVIIPAKYINRLVTIIAFNDEKNQGNNNS